MRRFEARDKVTFSSYSFSFSYSFSSSLNTCSFLGRLRNREEEGEGEREREGESTRLALDALIRERRFGGFGLCGCCRPNGGWSGACEWWGGGGRRHRR